MTSTATHLEISGTERHEARDCSRFGEELTTIWMNATTDRHALWLDFNRRRQARCPYGLKRTS